MPNDDLDRAFAALSGDAGHARLAPAEALRKRADRQTLTRSVSGVAAAVVLVAGVVVGSRIALADHALPPLPPAASSAPASVPPSASPSPSPSVVVATSPSSDPDSPDGSATSSRPPTIPKAIPDRAFLRGSDTNGGRPKQMNEDGMVPLTVCGPSSFGSEEQVGVRDGIEVYLEDGRPDHTPLATVDELVTIYRGAGAEKFLDEARAELKNCSDGGDDATTYRSVGSLGLGDESVLVRGSTPARGDDGELVPGGGTRDDYVARIRVGDTVVELLVFGYESQSVQRADVDALAGKAVQRLRDWRD